MGELDDGECLADAAAVLAARQRVDPLLLRLAAQPFDVEAIRALRRWLDEVYPEVAPAWDRLADAPDSTPADVIVAASGAVRHLTVLPGAHAAAVGDTPIWPEPSDIA